jgi:hypothetical protein
MIFPLFIIVKPIMKMFFHGKELKTNNLTIIENTFEIIRCRILSNPSVGSDIQWFKNDQLILGKIIELSGEDELIDDLMIIGEYHEQLGMNFTAGIDQLSCRAKNTIGQTVESIHINLLCKIRKKKKKIFRKKSFFFLI